MNSTVDPRDRNHFPAELEDAWNALRSFVLDIVKEAEKEQKLQEKLKKTP